MRYNEVNKVVQPDLLGIIRYQIMTHCFTHDIFLNKTELECLTLLGYTGKVRLKDFCELATQHNIFGSPTAVNNCLTRIGRSNLFLKEGGGKKQIFLNPDLKIQTAGNIVLNYKFVYIDPNSTLDGGD